MVCQYLKLGVRDTPVLIGSTLFEDLLILHHIAHFVLAARDEVNGFLHAGGYVDDLVQHIFLV